MARKLQVQMQTWLPKVIKCYLDYETLNTFETVKDIGRILVSLSAEDQLQEINHVLQILVDSKLLVPGEKSKVHYWGIDFESTVYEPTPEFVAMVNEASSSTTVQQSTKEPGKEVKVEQKIININFNIAIDKILEINPTLKASLIGL